MTAPTEDLIARLEANETLPVCPYDRRSPDYWTTDDVSPCKICGTKNQDGAPDLCRGADTRVMKEAATALRALQQEVERLRDVLTELLYEDSDKSDMDRIVTRLKARSALTGSAQG